MKGSRGTAAALGAIAGSLASLSCCLPLGLVAALGTGAASAFLTTLRPWLVGASLALLALGFWQQRRAVQCATRFGWLSRALLWLAVVVVIGNAVLPQLFAGLIADSFAGNGR